MEIIVSGSNNPAYNLAEEERLLMTERPVGVLFLYINSPSIILGRNQVPEAEADLDFCRDNGILVIRRASGGGAVYHDHGNINYSFIVETDGESVLDRDFLSDIVAILGSMGVKAEVGRRRELLAEGMKISGTASHVKRGRQLFHGTLLYDADLGMLSRALRGDESKRGKGVASIPGNVANIRELYGKEISAEEFFSRFAEECRRYFSQIKHDS